MTPRKTRKNTVFTSEEIEVIRSVLAACSQVLYWAERHGDRQFRATLAAATRAADGGRSPGHLRYDVCVAIDCLDFPPTARSRR